MSSCWRQCVGQAADSSMTRNESVRSFLLVESTPAGPESRSVVDVMPKWGRKWVVTGDHQVEGCQARVEEYGQRLSSPDEHLKVAVRKFCFVRRAAHGRYGRGLEREEREDQGSRSWAKPCSQLNGEAN